MSGKNLFQDHDVVVTDQDPAELMNDPGVHLVMDVARGVVETVEVGHDGSRRLLKCEPIAAPAGGGEARGGGALRVLAVGKPYLPSVSRFPEGTQAHIWPGGMQLALLLDKPTATEVDQARTAKLSVRLLAAPHTMLFLFRLGDGPWQDAPFNAHHLSAEDRACPPDPGPGHGWLLQLVLVDASTGIVRALRGIGLSRKFSCAVLKAFEVQLAGGPDDAAHGREVQRFYRKSTKALAADAIDRFEQGDTAS